MVLTVEDGSIVSGADSYITLSAARTFLSSVGLSLATVDADAEVQLRKAFYHIEAMNFLGSVTDTAQLTQFPRKDIVRYGVALPDNAIPPEISRAQAYIAAAIQSGVSVDVAGASPIQTASQKVGELEVSYFKEPAYTPTRIPAAQNLLKNFLATRSGVVVRA